MKNKKMRISIFSLISVLILILIGIGIIIFAQSNNSDRKEQNRNNKPDATVDKLLTKDEAVKIMKEMVLAEEVKYQKEDNTHYYFIVGDDKLYSVDKSNGVTSLYSQKMKSAGIGPSKE